MAEIPPIAVSVQLKIDQVNSQVDQVKTKLTQLGDHAKESGSKFTEFGAMVKESMASLGLIAGIAEAINFIKESTTAAGNNAQQQIELQRQLKITSGATKEQSKAVDEHIEALADMSGVVATNIRPSFEVFSRVTHDTTKAMNLQKVALDVAAGTGKDVSTVSNAMAKAVAGNTTQLARLVPGLKNAKDPLATLQKEFKGAAKAAADTNPMGRFNVAMEKMKIALGQGLLPVIKALTTIIKPLTPLFSMIGQILGAILTPIMRVVSSLLKALMPALDAIVKIVLTVIRAAMKPLEAVIKALMPTITMLAKFVGHLLNAIAPLIPIVIKLWFQFNPVLNLFMLLTKSVLPPLIEILDKFLLPIIQAVVEIYKKLYAAVEKTANYLSQIFQPVITAVGDAFKQLGAMLQPVWDNVLKPMLDGLMALMGIKAEPTVTVTADTTDLTGAGSIANLVPDTAKGGGATSSSSDKKDSPLIGYLQNTQDKILALQKSYHEKVAAANAKYKDAIQKQVSDFKNEFANATVTDVGGLFRAGYQSADQMIFALKDKLSSVKNFASDAGKLASAGFSKDFIQQVMAQGPVIGDQMAQSILSASPEAQKQMQDLFTQTQDASTHGVDDLAKRMADQFHTSTHALTTALNKAAQALRDNLSLLDVHVARKVKSMHGNIGNAATTLTQTQTKLQTAETTAAGYTVNVTNHNSTNASPAQIAQATVSSIKFGLPYSVSPIGG